MNTNLGKIHKSSKDRFKLAALLGKKEKKVCVCGGVKTDMQKQQHCSAN